MGVGVSVFLLALGAILTFAVDATLSGVDLDVVGIILMVAGAIGLLTFLLYLNRTTPPPAGRRVVQERTVVRDDDLL